MGPQPHTSGDQVFFIVVREDDNRNLARLLLRPQFPQHLEAIHLRQANVEKDDVRLQIAGFLEALLAVQGGVDAVPVEFQLEPVHLEDGGIVFQGENVDQALVDLSRLAGRARASAAAGLTFHNTPLGAKQYRRSWCIESRPLREVIRRTPREAYVYVSNAPEGRAPPPPRAR